MESERAFRPRVSRETRLLLTTALLATVALWTLARVQPASVSGTATIVPPVLSTFTLGAQHDGLAAEIARVQARLAGVLVALRTDDGSADGAPARVVGLRMGPDLVLTARPGVRLDTDEGLTLVATDPASGLTLIRTPVANRSGLPVPWIPPSRPSPRYLVATDLAGAAVGLHPVFVHAFERATSALWPDMWSIGTAETLDAGTILFTIDGELVGFVLDDRGSPVVLPATTAFEEMGRLGSQQNRVAGWLGIETHALTPTLAKATGASTGAVVAWVDPAVDAASALSPGHVIDRWNDAPITSVRDWDVHAMRLRGGEQVRLGVRMPEGRRELPVMARTAPSALSTTPTAEPSARRLGMALRRAGPDGTEVMRVEPASAASNADLMRGDVITRIGEIVSPTPAQITQAFSRAPPHAPILVAVTRGHSHLVTTLEK